MVGPTAQPSSLAGPGTAAKEELTFVYFVRGGRREGSDGVWAVQGSKTELTGAQKMLPLLPRLVVGWGVAFDLWTPDWSSG